jgi:hypothetical protein
MKNAGTILIVVGKGESFSKETEKRIFKNLESRNNLKDFFSSNSKIKILRVPINCFKDINKKKQKAIRNRLLNEDIRIGVFYNMNTPIFSFTKSEKERKIFKIVNVQL